MSAKGKRPEMAPMFFTLPVKKEGLAIGYPNEMSKCNFSSLQSCSILILYILNKEEFRLKNHTEKYTKLGKHAQLLASDGKNLKNLLDQKRAIQRSVT